MASLEEKVNCVLWLAEPKSVTAIQRRFRAHYNKEAPHRNFISKWMKKLQETSSVNDRPQSGRPSFQKPNAKIPWKAIFLAIILFVLGSAMLVTSSLIFTGYIEHAEGGNWALLVLGLIMFIPGSYHVWIAYYAYRQYPGYSFDDIPDFD